MPPRRRKQQSSSRSLPPPLTGLPLDRNERWVLLAILVAAVLVRLPGLFTGLWHDEIMYSWVYFDNPGLRSWLLWGDVHPPVYALLLWLWSAVFGNHEAVLRAPSFLAGMLSLLVTWSLARRGFGRGTALLALAFLAFSPPHIWYSVENKANMLVLFLSVWSLWLGARAAERPDAGWNWVLLTLVVLLALGTHAYALATFGTVITWLGWRSWHEGKLRRHTAAVGIIVLGAWLPLFLWKTLSQGATLARPYLRSFTAAEIYKLLLVWTPHGNTLRCISPYGSLRQLLGQSWGYFLVDAFCAALLLLGLVAAVREARVRGDSSAGEQGLWPSRLLLLWLLPPLVVAALASLVVRRFYIERNFLLLLPAYAILLGLGVARLRRPRLRLVMGVGLLAFGMAATLSLLVWRHDRWTVYKPKPDWRAAARFLRSEAEQRGRMVVVTTTPSLEAEFYLRPSPSSYPAIAVADFCGGKYTPSLLASHGGGSFWLVKNETWEGCWAGAWRKVADSPGIRLRGQRSFSSLVLYELAAK